MCTCWYWRFLGVGISPNRCLTLTHDQEYQRQNSLRIDRSFLFPQFSSLYSFLEISTTLVVITKNMRHSSLLLTNLNFDMLGTSSRTLFTLGVEVLDPLTSFFFIHSNGNCVELNQLCERGLSDPVCAGGHKVAISERERGLALCYDPPPLWQPFPRCSRRTGHRKYCVLHYHSFHPLFLMHFWHKLMLTLSALIYNVLCRFFFPSII